MLKKIGLGLLALVAVLIAVIASRPSTFEIKRSLLINASPEVVFAQVNDFKSWATWSPWDHMDPSMKKTYSGAETGVGAHYAWVGNKDVGEGSMTITDSKPSEHIGLDLEFVTPMAGDGTTVTWTMSGKNNFMGKAFSLVMDMEKMVGPSFEKGLAAMKTASETAAADAAKKAADDAAAAAAAAVPTETTDAGTPGADAGTP
jgi:Polyketide cyclase / dehydrase and lipid transport